MQFGSVASALRNIRTNNYGLLRIIAFVLSIFKSVLMAHVFVSTDTLCRFTCESSYMHEEILERFVFEGLNFQGFRL